jgi:hypothetical protein
MAATGLPLIGQRSGDTHIKDEDTSMTLVHLLPTT